ncbi:MAG: ATP-binding cassette domain-containing protein [Burkholderiaceae bacterium]|jgi:sulfonate transport system ATP-binding protein
MFGSNLVLEGALLSDPGQRKSLEDVEWQPSSQPTPLLPKGGAVQVELERLSKHFGDRTVLEDVNLKVKPGQFVAVVGRSGCGKSTLLRLLAGLETPSEVPSLGRGSIRFDGRAQHGIDPQTRMMFQDARLLPWKRVLDNVALGLDSAGRARALEVLGQVGLEERASDWPAILSGGQRQRVALARALVNAPRLLLLDEPLGALDALTRIEMQDLIAKLWTEKRFTAVLVTHDVAEAIALADRIILIDNGKISLDLEVDLPRPRSRGSPGFAALEDQVLQRVMKQPDAPVSPPLATVTDFRTLRLAI